MSNIPTNIIIKIMQYLAELNSLNKLHLNQELMVSQLRKPWQKIHDQLMDTTQWLLYDSLGRYSLNLDLPKEYSFADILPGLVDDDNFTEFKSGGRWQIN